MAVDLLVRAMSADERRLVRGWRYVDVDEDTTIVDRPGHEAFAVIWAGHLVGYCGFGKLAMMPGYSDEEHFVGIAWGLRPDLLGNGNGSRFVAAVAGFGADRYRPRRVQAVIKQRNPRSLRAALGAGFVKVDEIRNRAVLWWPEAE